MSSRPRRPSCVKPDASCSIRLPYGSRLATFSGSDGTWSFCSLSFISVALVSGRMNGNGDGSVPVTGLGDAIIRIGIDL